MGSIRIRWGVYPALAGLALAAGLGAVPSHAASSLPYSLAYTVVSQSKVGVSDLDGDGLGDVMVNEERPGNDMQFRRGSDGALLWSLPLNDQGVLGIIRAGGGRPAVLAVRYPDQALRAFDGRTGQLLWSSTALAPYNSWVVGYLPGKPWQATRILAQRPSDVGYTPIVVSGLDGTSRRAGLPGENIAAIGDEDGDGYGDIVVANGNELAVRSSTTGKGIWAKVFAFPLVYPYRLPDITGDHRDDILAMDQSGLTTRATAVDGHTGAKLWTMSQPTTDLQALGDANHDGHTDLVAIGQGGCAAGATVYSGASGRVLWQRTYLNPGGPCQGPGDHSPVIGLAGDVNTDGASDVIVDIGSPGQGTLGMVSGGNGGWLWQRPWPASQTNWEDGLDASFDGTGDDLAPSFYEPAVTVFDGRTNVQLFSVPTRDRVWEQPAQAGQLNADNVPDLVYATLPYDNTGAWTGRPVQIGVVDGATHAMRWTADVG